MSDQQDDEPQNAFDAYGDEEEIRVQAAAVDSFQKLAKNYGPTITHHRRQEFYKLPAEHQEILSAPPFNLLDKLIDIDKALATNEVLANALTTTGLDMFNFHPTTDLAAPTQPNSPAPYDWRGAASRLDLHKAHVTLRQFYRDWSTEGKPERDASLGPVLQHLDDEFAHIPRTERDALKVLIPGAGLARLVLEVCCRGYFAEGNEISYHCAIASNLVLNQTRRAEEFVLYPWAHGFNNHVARSDQLRAVKIPDVHPGTALDEASVGCRVHAYERMNMCAGDFIAVYASEKEAGSFAAVLTVFFIDTAPNFLRYVEAVRNCLRPGGVWINLGPLLWHGAPRRDNEQGDGSSGLFGPAAGIGEAGSVELTHEEVMLVLKRFGFAVEVEKVGGLQTGYIQDPNSMQRNMYEPVLWVARKV